MAEMLVNSTKLDACLSAEADAIRAKTGGSSPIPYDYANNKGFADAIAAIPSGGGGATSFTFNPLTTVSNNNAPACLQSILDSVQPVIGDVPFYVAWVDGDKPSNYVTTMLYIPVGWKCGGVALASVVAIGSRAGNLSTHNIMYTGTGYYINISTNSLYRCVSLAECFVKEV